VPARTVPGARVELRGAGFTPGTQVFIDGHAVAIETLRPDLIVFVAPHHEGAGTIVLRDPRLGDVAVGTLVVDVRGPGHPGVPGYGHGPPGYGHGAPGYGRPLVPVIGSVRFEADARGVRIIVDGHGFSPDDEILVGGHRGPVQLRGDGTAVAWAPHGTTGPVHWLCHHDGRRYDTGAFLRAGHGGYLPGPGYRPGYGLPGVRRSPLDALRDPWGASPAWRGTAAPRISTVRVTDGWRGETVVVVHGGGFGLDAQVLLGGVLVPIVQASDRELVVAVPRGLFGQMPVEVVSRGRRVLAAEQVLLGPR
jgi:hypothetical protein